MTTWIDRSVSKRPPSPPFSPVPPSTNARARSQLSFAARGRIRGRRSSLFDRRFSLDEIGPPPRERKNPLSQLTYEEMRLRSLPSTLGRVYSEFLSRPGQQLLLGALFLLLGFYLAGSLSTIFGAAAGLG